jgi:hypothetical protein
MDPDMVRQQEEAEREALALAAQRLAKGPAPASPIVLEAAAELVETPALAEPVAPSPPIYIERPVAIEASVPVQTAPAPKKSKAHPARRALPPISARGSRAPAPDRIRGGVIRGVARFLGYALAGAMLGVILGNAATALLDLAPENNATVIYSAMGCFAFIYALISILHHEH